VVCARTRLALTAAVALGLATPALAPAQGAPAAPAAVERAVIREMNAVRARAGVPALRAVRVLSRPARSHSAFMATTGVFRHEGRNGAPFWRRLVAAGFPRSRRMGENIAMVGACHPRAAAQVVALWMASPPHRANLLDRRFRVAGVGVADAGRCGELLVTADYGG
jgi:uncharacterized protein YkwD